MVWVFIILMMNFLLKYSPFFMNLWLILMSLFLACWALLLCSKWMFSILIIFFLGGLMVLFAYMISLVKSKQIFFSLKFKEFLIFTPLLFVPTPTFPTLMFKMSLFLSPNAYLLALIVLTLLFLLIIVNKITFMNHGPMIFKNHD